MTFEASTTSNPAHKAIAEATTTKNEENQKKENGKQKVEVLPFLEKQNMTSIFCWSRKHHRKTSPSTWELRLADNFH